jgi:aerobic C4-dicarboxylate transport protein
LWYFDGSQTSVQERFIVAKAAVRAPFYTRLSFQVLAGIVLGVILGFLWPETGVAMRPLGDGFIKLIRMIIAPIIFGTVVVGIAKMGDMKEVGRIGVKALIYFEVVSTLALLLGLIVVNVAQPGAGINADPATLDAEAVKAYTSTAQTLTTTQFILNIIPTTFVDAFARGEILQVLLVSILFGLALLHMKEKAKPLIAFLDDFTHAMFGVVGMIMQVGAIGAFGAMAFTIGQFGVGTLLSLGKLLTAVFLTCAVFVVFILGGVARWCGFSILKFLRYIKEELLIVLGTSSSETVLPRLMVKLENLGCAKPVVGLVIPTGYSFNLDGTSVYMTMAAVFIAQATNTSLTIGQQLGILAVLLLTSKGAAAVTGGGFITLAATLSAIPTLPVAGLALLIGVDRFMSGARALTNLVGNGVACIAVAKWDGALDARRMKKVLDGETVLEADAPEEVLVAHETLAARH